MNRSVAKFSLRGVAALAAGFALVGCASHASLIRVGESAADVRARVGVPFVVTRTADGERLLYPTAPFGQSAYLVDVGRDGRVRGVSEALTDERFYRITKGEWTLAQVQQEFGPPAETSVQPLKHQQIWSYRYRQQGVWNSLMHVHFDEAGIVQDYYPGPDPHFDPDARRFPRLSR
jgi:hypothetical protein